MARVFFAGVFGAVEDDGVEVAVAGVEDVGDAEVFGGGHCGRSFRGLRGALVRGMTPSCTM